METHQDQNKRLEVSIDVSDIEPDPRTIDAKCPFVLLTFAFDPMALSQRDRMSAHRQCRVSPAVGAAGDAVLGQVPEAM